jgi:hypothetical protein
MSISGSAMAAAVKAKFENIVNSTDWTNSAELPTASDFQAAFGDGIKEYLESNVSLSYSWIALMPSPANTPDPVTSFTAKLSYSSFSIDVPSSFATWVTSIQNAVLGASIVPDDSTFLLSSPSLLTVALSIAKGGTMLDICNEICSWLKTCINPAPVSGSHLLFTVPSPGAIMISIS